MQEWLQKQDRDDEEIQAIVTGFKRALNKSALTSISFSDFAKQFQWLIKTLKVKSRSYSTHHAYEPIGLASCKRQGKRCHYCRAVKDKCNLLLVVTFRWIYIA